MILVSTAAMAVSDAPPGVGPAGSESHDGTDAQADSSTAPSFSDALASAGAASESGGALQTGTKATHTHKANRSSSSDAAAAPDASTASQPVIAQPVAVQAASVLAAIMQSPAAIVSGDHGHATTTPTSTDDTMLQSGDSPSTAVGANQSVASSTVRGRIGDPLAGSSSASSGKGDDTESGSTLQSGAVPSSTGATWYLSHAVSKETATPTTADPVDDGATTRATLTNSSAGASSGPTTDEIAVILAGLSRATGLSSGTAKSQSTAHAGGLPDTSTAETGVSLAALGGDRVSGIRPAVRTGVVQDGVDAAKDASLSSAEAAGLADALATHGEGASLRDNHLSHDTQNLAGATLGKSLGRGGQSVGSIATLPTSGLAVDGARPDGAPAARSLSNGAIGEIATPTDAPSQTGTSAGQAHTTHESGVPSAAQHDSGASDAAHDGMSPVTPAYAATDRPASTTALRAAPSQASATGERVEERQAHRPEGLSSADQIDAATGATSSSQALPTVEVPRILPVQAQSAAAHSPITRLSQPVASQDKVSSPKIDRDTSPAVSALIGETVAKQTSAGSGDTRDDDSRGHKGGAKEPVNATQRMGEAGHAVQTPTPFALAAASTPGGTQESGSSTNDSALNTQASFRPIVDGVVVHHAALHVDGSSSSFRVVLEPKALGQVIVHVTQGRDGLQVSLTPQRDDTGTLLHAHMAELVASLNDTNIGPVHASIVLHGDTSSSASSMAGQSSMSQDSSGRGFAASSGDSRQGRQQSEGDRTYLTQYRPGIDTVAPSRARVAGFAARSAGTARVDVHV